MSNKKISTVFIIFSIIVVLALIVRDIYLNLGHKDFEFTEESIEATATDSIITIYDIPIDDYHVIFDTVKRNETLGGILQRYGISAYQVDIISRICRDTFNVTRINPGRPYAVFISNPDDSISQTEYFIYENGSVAYTKYEFISRDSIEITKHRRNIDTVQKTASGIIKSSLWNAIVGQNLSWELAIALSQTFAWTVDFYALQKDDAFKVVYDEYFVDNYSIGIGEIKAGIFYHHGRDLWAIPFEQDGVKGFFDTLGNNTRKTFMKAPLKYTRVSSRYSHARMHPIHNRPRAHLAVDFAAPTGTPVYAASDGVIVTRAYGAGPGYYIKIRHNSVYSTVYMHFSRFGNYHVGDFVSQGDIIGYVGSTGWSTGPHLHYEIHENGQRIDPLSFEPPPAEPVDSSNMERFNKEKQKWIKKINNIKL